MTLLSTFEASEANVTDRFRSISDAISDNFAAPHYVQPVGERHRAALMRWASADGVVMSRAHMPSLYLENRTPRPRRAPKYFLWQADQASRLWLRGRDPIHLQPDEFVLITSDMANEWTVPRDFTTTCLIIDSELVDECLPRAAELLARRLSLPFGLDTVLHAMVDSAWAMCSAGRFEQLGTGLVRAVLQTLSTVPGNGAPDPLPPHKTPLEIRRAQARAFIEKHYAQPDLSITTIAEHLNVSRRYLQMAFKSDCTTPSEYVRTCRLAAAARLLMDPEHSGRTITEIAFACGFNSSPHFSSEFKEAYGVSPRSYRGGAPAEQSGAGDDPEQRTVAG
jgi:AraC-like DNA-binding protein